MEDNHIRILCIGNSFSEDTTAHVPKIAKSLGFKPILIANLYIGGCPITKHYHNLLQDAPVYRYDRNDGTRWVSHEGCSIREAIESESWDWISIQHGSSDGNRYTDPDCYRDLPLLVAQVKALAGAHTKIAFNMTWTGESNFDHHEIVENGGDIDLLFQKIVTITEQVVGQVEGIDRIIPTGTAVHNARATALVSRLHRDGYHLSMDIGRYLAGLIFFQTLSNTSTDDIRWKPQNVSDEEKKLLLRMVALASKSPYRV